MSCRPPPKAVWTPKDLEKIETMRAGKVNRQPYGVVPNRENFIPKKRDAVSQCKAALDILMAQPEKPVMIPEPMQEIHAPKDPKEFNMNIMVLQDSPADIDALSCKVVALIQLSKFKDALSFMSANEFFSTHYVFERAYCLYRESEYDEALRLIASTISNNSDDDITKYRELEGQIYHRIESYEKSFDLYSSLLSQNSISDDREIEANLAAVCALGLLSGDIESSKAYEKTFSLATYELAYNVACISLSSYQSGETKCLERALVELDEAERLCKETLIQEEFAEDEIEAELGIITVQRGVVLHLLRRHDDAMVIYNSYIRSKPEDAALLAIASNNLVVLNGNHGVFDSKKKIRALNANGVANRLTGRQRRSFMVNRALLALHASQFTEFASIVDSLQKDSESGIHSETISDTVSLLRAALVSMKEKDKKSDSAIKILRERVSSSGSVRVAISLAQRLVALGRFEEALAIVSSDFGDLKPYPAIVSAQVDLIRRCNKGTDAASVVFDAAIDHWGQSKSVKRTDHILTLMRHSADFKAANGKPQEAVELYLKLVQADPNDQRALSRLILAYSQFDLRQAEMYAARFPPIDSSRCDVDQLENVTVQPRARKQEDSAVTASPATRRTTEKKKRKVRLPKNYNPNVAPDPERWLPKWQRSYFKRSRKQKKAIAESRGAQGSATATPSGTIGRTGSAFIEGYGDGGNTTAPAKEAKEKVAPPRLSATQQKKQQQKKKAKKKK